MSARGLDSRRFDRGPLTVADRGCMWAAIGVIAALWAGKWAKPLLFDVSPRDPMVFGVVTATLIIVAAAAA